MTITTLTVHCVSKRPACRAAQRDSVLFTEASLQKAAAAVNVQGAVSWKTFVHAAGKNISEFQLDASPSGSWGCTCLLYQQHKLKFLLWRGRQASVELMDWISFQMSAADIKHHVRSSDKWGWAGGKIQNRSDMVPKTSEQRYMTSDTKTHEGNIMRTYK